MVRTGWPSTCGLVSWFASPLVYRLLLAFLGGVVNFRRAPVHYGPGTIPEGCRVHVPRGTMTVSESLWACDKQGLRPREGGRPYPGEQPRLATHTHTHTHIHLAEVWSDELWS